MSTVTELLNRVELSPGQLAELRAINSLCYTQLSRNANASSESRTVLNDLVLARARDMLDGDQQVLFDKNRAACQSAEASDGARGERYL